MLFSLGTKAQSFYASDSIQKIELYFTEPNWDYQLDTAKLGSGSYLMASVRLNGVNYDSVGVKYKGNSSFDSSNAKNPFHIELNTFKDQNHQGFTDIKLSNGYGDPSLIREVLSYRILNLYMKAPQSTFAQLYVNGNYIGLYSSAESINDKFCERKFASSNGTFIKGNPTITPGPAVKSNLKFLGEDSSAYFNYYEMKSIAGWTDLKNLCYTISNQPENLESILDIDKTLWMLAFNNLFINLDAYSGVFAQNYYLYKDANQVFNPIVWDLNMNFGAFPFAGSPNNGMGSLSVSNMQQLSPVYHYNHSDWPLIQTILSNAKWKKKYLAHLKTMLTEMIDSGVCYNWADSYQNQIRASVLSDSNKFFTNAQFEGSLDNNYTFSSYQVPGIKTLMNARSLYLKSSAEFKLEAPVISFVNFSNAFPTKGTEVAVMVQVSNATQVYFSYRFSSNAIFQELQLFDDGLHQDGNAGDGLFGNTFTVQDLSTQYFIFAENNDAGIFSPARAQHEFYYLGKQASLLNTGKVFINEVLASNDQSDINEYGIYTDWIELYNASSDTVSLYGSYLSDDIRNPYKYAFPSNSTIEPRKFLMVWADGLANTSKYCHANFTLSSHGDEVYLSNSKGELIDSMSFGAQAADRSFGRCPDASSNLVQIYPATFQEYNKFFCVSGLKITNKDFSLRLYPNPVSDRLTIETAFENLKELKIYNLFGEELLSFATNEFTSELDLSHLNSGVYLLQVKWSSDQTQSFRIIKN